MKENEKLIALILSFGGIILLLIGLIDQQIMLIVFGSLSIPGGTLFYYLFERMEKQRLREVQQNRQKLFAKIPKDELFKEGSIFVDKFEGDEKN